MARRRRATGGFGHGHWPRAQLFAIIKQYREKGHGEAWVAQRLGVSCRMVEQVFAYFDWWEEVEADEQPSDDDWAGGA